AEFGELAFEQFEVVVEVGVAPGRELVEPGKKGAYVANAGYVVVAVHIQSFRLRAEPKPRPAVELVFLLGDDSQRDAAVKRYTFDLHVEPLAVAVPPGCPDAGPEALLVAIFALADMVDGVRRRFAGRGFGFSAG